MFLDAVMFIWDVFTGLATGKINFNFHHPCVEVDQLLSRSTSDQVLHIWNCWHKIGATVNRCDWVRREVLCIVAIQCGTTLHQVRLIKMCLIETYSTVPELGPHSWYGKQTLGWTLWVSVPGGETYFFFSRTFRPAVDPIQPPVWSCFRVKWPGCEADLTPVVEL
jgi:hypothetical protein